jgi:hypothetical protein
MLDHSVSAGSYEILPAYWRKLLVAILTPGPAPNDTKHAALGPFRTRLVVATSSEPTFSTHW